MSGEGEQRESDSIPARVNLDSTNTEIFGDSQRNFINGKIKRKIADFCVASSTHFKHGIQHKI